MRKRASREKLEEILRRSRRALPGMVAFAVVGPVIVWGITRLFQTPFHYWVVIPVLGAPISQVINMAYCRRALRHLPQGKPHE